eukprot:GHVT01095873.1.p1 GENE.GHVT01095873.1~~GHVT01095873.1.p1  ORF type:complete len:739 (-),score=166.92 GHVT01095873.1:164-2176(-)
MALFQPVGQVRLTNVAVVRLLSHGRRFEIACYKNKVLNWRDGLEVDLSEVLQSVAVFHNVSKGEFVKKEALIEAFGTNDQEHVCREILNKGELQISSQERSSALSAAFRDVVNLLVVMTVNPQTGMQHTPYMIEAALRENGFSVQLGDSTKKQALKAIELLQRHLPTMISRAFLRMRISCHAKHQCTVKKFLVEVCQAEIEEETSTHQEREGDQDGDGKPHKSTREESFGHQNKRELQEQGRASQEQQTDGTAARARQLKSPVERRRRGRKTAVPEIVRVVEEEETEPKPQSLADVATGNTSLKKKPKKIKKGRRKRRDDEGDELWKVLLDRSQENQIVDAIHNLDLHETHLPTRKTMPNHLLLLSESELEDDTEQELGQLNEREEEKDDDEQELEEEGEQEEAGGKATTLATRRDGTEEESQQPEPRKEQDENGQGSAKMKESDEAKTSNREEHQKEEGRTTLKAQQNKLIAHELKEGPIATLGLPNGPNEPIACTGALSTVSVPSSSLSSSSSSTSTSSSSSSSSSSSTFSTSSSTSPSLAVTGSSYSVQFLCCPHFYRPLESLIREQLTPAGSLQLLRSNVKCARVSPPAAASSCAPASSPSPADPSLAPSHTAAAAPREAHASQCPPNTRTQARATPEASAPGHTLANRESTRGIQIHGSPVTRTN